MSEINSIANGTYVIGETSATNFIAGNGIKIDEPSAGTVRIGNDETVLWSGAANMSAEPTLNLSESVNNFEFIDIYSMPHSNGTIPVVNRYYTKDATYSDTSFTVIHHAGGGGFRINNALLSISSLSAIRFTQARQTSIIGTTLSTAAPSNSFVKIVGINRISGSNA